MARTVRMTGTVPCSSTICLFCGFPPEKMSTRQPAGQRSEAALRAIYDQRYADQYDPHAGQRMRRLLPFFELSGQGVVADFGCGNGVLLELISPRVCAYTGVDFSDAFVQAAERRRDARGQNQ